MWQQIVHIASGGGADELEERFEKSDLINDLKCQDEEGQEYIIEDLNAENRELRRSRNALYGEVDRLRAQIDTTGGLTLFEELQR